MAAHQKEESNGSSHLASLLKDVKVQRVRLRENLKGEAPIDYKTLTLHRKALRNVFLKLLFKYPFSSRTSGVESELWNETSLNGVDHYRKKLKKIDVQYKEQEAKKISVGFTHITDKERALSQQYSRIQASFRAFLTSEVVFWRELMGRVTRVFSVDEAKPYLQAVDVVSDPNAPQQISSEEGEINTGLDRIAVGFNEELDLELQGRMPANRQRLIEIIHKCLVSCGDLSRYIELYKEESAADSKNSVSVANSRGAKRRGRGGRGGAPSERSLPTKPTADTRLIKRDYSQSKLYYEQARSLVPSHGQPSNQIAVLYSYEGDQFASTYHYYRALCVTAPFKQARKNMDTMLTRAVEKWDASGNRGENQVSTEGIDAQKKALFELLIVLHGHFFESSDRFASKELYHDFQSLLTSVIREKALAADSIVQIVVASIACLWTRRLWRGEPTKKEVQTPILNSAEAEQAILQHLLSVMTVFLRVSISETREALETIKRDSNGDLLGEGADQSSVLAKKITAVFRRMLPAMRISSKWIKSHVEYIEKSRSPTVNQASSGSDSQEPSQKNMEALKEAIQVFWTEYVEFINTIRFAFPFDQLPKLGTVGQSGMTSLDFEEDRDMRGFLPMKKAMLIDAKSSVDNVNEAEPLLHPNEEHLIRIADLLIDAKVIAESASSPISFNDEKYSFQVTLAMSTQEELASLARESHVDVAASEKLFGQSYDSKWERGSESTEDAVDLAMRAVDERRQALNGRGEESFSREEGEEEEEDDGDDGEIILVPASGRSHLQINTPKATPASVATEERKMTPTGGPLTAQHLLLQMLNGNRTKESISTNTPGASMPKPQLLFGGINSTPSQSPFTASVTSPWDGNEAAQFVNQQQIQQRQQQPRQNSNAFAHSALDPSSPWNPPNASQKSEGWR